MGATTLSERQPYCGTTYKNGDKPFPQNSVCCPALGSDYKTDCDHKYWNAGPSWTDFVDFMRKESLWLRVFTRAWHVATDNGWDSLTYINKTKGPGSDDPNSKESVVCIHHHLNQTTRKIARSATAKCHKTPQCMA
jgi:hypothetical protein